MQNLQQIVHHLLENGYMMVIKGKYVVTAKFNKEITGQEIGLIKINNLPVVMETPPPAALITVPTDWPMKFMRFISEAQVPKKGSSAGGQEYDINQYSEPAMKVFRKMLEKEGIKYEVLVKSTMLYYKVHQTFQRTIGNYIADGYWRTDYYTLLQAAESGVDSLKTHIEKEISDARGHTHWKSAYD